MLRTNCGSGSRNSKVTLVGSEFPGTGHHVPLPPSSPDHGPLPAPPGTTKLPPTPSATSATSPPEHHPELGGRLHPAAIVVKSFGQLIPLIFVVFAGPFGLPILVGLGSIGLAVAALSWWRFTWRIEDGSLIIEQGLLERRRRAIPLSRIQSVETIRKLPHRIFGVVALRVESVGGSDSEGRLEALDPRQAEVVRAVLLRTRPRDDQPGAASSRTPPGQVLHHLGIKELVKAGVTGGRVSVVAALLGVSQDFWFGRVFDSGFVQLDARTLDSFLAGAGILAALSVTAAIVVFAISVFGTALAFWDFTLTQDDDSLWVRRGLIEQRSDTIPLRRIQAVRIEQNLVRRIFKLAAVKIEVAGRTGSAEQQRQTDVVLPIASMTAALALADRLVGGADLHPSIQAMPVGARSRRIIRAVVVSLLFCLPGVLDIRLLLAGLVIIPLVALAIAGYRSLGWAASANHVIAQSGFWLRRRWVVPTAGVQSLKVSATPFQRRRQLASLTLEIARSGNAGDPVLIDLAATDANRLAGELASASTEGGRVQVERRRDRLAETVS